MEWIIGIYVTSGVLSAGLDLMSIPNNSLAGTITRDGFWFAHLIPFLNIASVIIMIINLLKKDASLKPETKDAVYFLPLASLGLLYFV